LTLLGVHSTVGRRGQKFQHWILVKILIVLMLMTDTVTMLNFLVTAPASVQDALPASGWRWWLLAW
jgi:hypothetical protein